MISMLDMKVNSALGVIDRLVEKMDKAKVEALELIDVANIQIAITEEIAKNKIDSLEKTKRKCNRVVKLVNGMLR